jgi:hypothetical protein
MGRPLSPSQTAAGRPPCTTQSTALIVMSTANGLLGVAKSTMRVSRVTIRYAGRLSVAGRAHGLRYCLTVILPEARLRVRIGFQGATVLPNNLTKLFPLLLLACNIGAAICSAVAGDYRRSIYWASSSLCIGAITF